MTSKEKSVERKRWTYRVYVAGEFVKSFSSRTAARDFMENMTEMDLPFLVMPWNEKQMAYMIGEKK
jgi:hypothetical protein